MKYKVQVTEFVDEAPSRYGWIEVTASCPKLAAKAGLKKHPDALRILHRVIIHCRVWPEDSPLNFDGSPKRTAIVTFGQPNLFN